MFFENLCVKFMCETYGGVGGQDGLEHGITQCWLKDGALVEKTNSADLQVAIRPRFRWQLLLMGVRNDLRLAVVDSDVVVFQEHLKCHET